jgi:MinD-like ATPase involved in chromosome partitioning or flagellar assembly
VAEKIAEKIRELAELLDEEHIARALGLSVEVVRGVLSGEVPDEALDDFDPKKPPDVRLVERKKFIRSKLIGVCSTGGCGATTLTATLAVLSAKKSGLPVAAVDLNEFAGLGPALGLDTMGERAAFYPGVSWWSGGDVGESVVQHPALENLFAVLGAATAERYLELKEEVIASSLGEISGAYAVTWVDCPTWPGGWKTVVPLLDVLIFVLRPDAASLSSLWQAIPVLRDWEHKMALVISGDGLEGGMTAAECRRALKKVTNAPVLAVLPEESYIRHSSLDVRCYALDEPGSPYCQAVEGVLCELLPDAGPARKKQSGVLDALAGLFRRG